MKKHTQLLQMTTNICKQNETEAMAQIHRRSYEDLKTIFGLTTIL